MKQIIKYAISSNVRYKDIVLPKLLHSLKKTGIENNDIVVCIGSSKNAYIEINNDITYIYAKGSSFDFNSFIEISQIQLKSDFWFMLPDTSMAGENFKHFIETKSDFTKNVNVPYYQAIGNIGLFKMEYLIKHKDIFKEFKNVPTYIAGVGEGIAWLIAKRLENDNNDDCTYYPNHGFQIIGEPKDIYGNGTLRQIQYLPCIDLYKYMSNYVNQSVLKHTHNF